MVPAEKLTRALILGVPHDPKTAIKAQLQRFFTTWIALILLGCLTVSVFAQGAARDYQIDRLQAAYRSAQQENLVLRSELTALSGPVHLVAVAARLKYQTPAQELVVAVTPARTAVARRPQRSFWQVWASALASLHGTLLRVLTAL